MTSAHPGVERIEAALGAVGDALAAMDLERLLEAEAGLNAALSGLGVTTALEGPAAQELREAIDRTYAALLRCRRLGNSLLAFTRVTTEVAARPQYSRTGEMAVPASAGLLEMRG